MKIILGVIIGIALSYIILSVLSTRYNDKGYAGSKSKKDNFKMIIRSKEFAALSKTPEFDNLILSKTVLNFGKDYLADYIAEKYGILL